MRKSRENTLSAAGLDGCSNKTSLHTASLLSTEDFRLVVQNHCAHLVVFLKLKRFFKIENVGFSWTTYLKSSVLRDKRCWSYSNVFGGDIQSITDTSLLISEDHFMGEQRLSFSCIGNKYTIHYYIDANDIDYIYFYIFCEPNCSVSDIICKTKYIHKHPNVIIEN